MSKIKISPIGGVGQIGSNSTLFTIGNESILIDCGILFPREDFFDINYLIPDLSGIEEVPTKLIITHGHEDHIGAIHHFIDRFPSVEVWAPSFSKSLIERKLGHKKKSKKIHLYERGSKISCDNFDLYPIQVNHSIPDTFGILVQNEKHAIFLASDFKYDERPQYEPIFELERLNKLSENRNKVFLADSTNIRSKTLKTPSEADTVSEIENLIQKAEGRVFITTFSSNIFRIRNILEISKSLGKKVVLHGRSMKNYVESALNTGHILDDSMIREADQIKPTDKNLVILLSGCQGDFKGAFRRVAINEDTKFKIKEDDIFILSSKSIPGNEKKISLLLNSIYELGSKAYTASDCLVHVSGHPGKEDLKTVYDSYKPNISIPIHGESEFIAAHCDWLKKEYPNTIPVRLKNFDSIIIDEKIKVIESKNPPAPILIHGKDVEIEKEVITQRRKIACNGIVFVSISKESLSKRVIKSDITYQGIPNWCIEEHREHFENFIHEFVKSRKIKLLKDTAEDVRVETRRYFNNILGYRPIAIIHFV